MVTIVFGAQWGDEGKGKIIDLLSQKAAYVVRFHGGNNAGHTVINRYGTFPLHLVPSGIFSRKSKSCIANGVVLDLEVLAKEIALIQKAIPDIGRRLLISPRAHVIMPYHKQMDALNESAKGKKKTGTTGRGIGPVHADKVSYLGIRLFDFYHKELLQEKIELNLRLKNPLFAHFKFPVLRAAEVYQEQMKWFRKIKAYISEPWPLLQKALASKQFILGEGAQGMFLDNDWGTYPFVTASRIVSGSITGSAGIPPQSIKSVIGVTKAYTTRVGEGPFPTELFDEESDAIRKIGHEYGATTGRPRRCGWLDLELLKFTARINGVTDWVVTKLDILDTFKKIKVCTGYTRNGKKVGYVDGDAGSLYQVKPVYKIFPGWETDTSAIREFSKLPKNAKTYIRFIEEHTGVRVSIVSVGAERNQIIPVRRSRELYL